MATAPPRRPAAPAPRAPARSAAPTRAPSRGPARPAVSGNYRGAAGLARMEQAQQENEARRAARGTGREPFRYFLTPGTSGDYVIVDEGLDFFRWEHEMRDRDNRRSHLNCIKEHANCPICESGPEKPSYFAAFLTIIDLVPFTTRGGEEVPWSKKLLVIKPSVVKKFSRLQERYGTLRGLRITPSRDGERDAAIGNDIEVTEEWGEDALAEYVSEYTDSQGKVHEVIGYEPFNYDEVLPEHTEETLAGLVGAPVNNYAGARRAAGGDQDGWQQPAARPAARPAPRPAARPAPAPAPAARPAPRPAARPASRIAPEDQPDAGADEGAYDEGADDGQDPPFEPDPPARRPVTRAAPPARPAPRQPARPADPPQRAGPVDLAARRAALRGGR